MVDMKSLIPLAFAGLLALPSFAPAADPEDIAHGLADAVNRQSAVVKCGVNSGSRQIVCTVAGGITTASAERFADHLAAVARSRGMPGGWAVIMVHEK